MEDIGHISMHLTVSSSSAVFHFDVISLRNCICLHLVVGVVSINRFCRVAKSTVLEIS